MNNFQKHFIGHQYLAFYISHKNGVKNFLI